MWKFTDDTTISEIVALQAFHARLPGYLSNHIERIQKQALRITYPELSYREALEDANLMSLYAPSWVH